MSDPILRSALADLDLVSGGRSPDRSAGVSASEAAVQTVISLRGRSDDAAFIAAASAALGFTLPVEPCTLASSGSSKALWISPDEWLITAPRAQKARLLQGLEQGLRGLRSQVVDNSGGYTVLRIEGRNATELLTHLTVYPVRELEAGRVVGTTLGKLSGYLYRDGSGWRVVVRRSFAGYVWQMLEQAALPYGFAVAGSGGDGNA